MNDADVREMLWRILADEPNYEIAVEDDVARGRSLRTQLRQRRTSASTTIATSA
jgi:hypothetical protein